MKPAQFNYHAPSSLEDALALLAEYGDDGKILAGGQSLVPVMNVRLARPEHIIDINGIMGLSEITEESGHLVIGALARHSEIESSGLVRDRLPLLAEAARHIGHYAIRKRGTFGGSLCHADPAAEWPLMAVVLDAEVEIAKTGGMRTVAARDFIQSVYTTDLEDDEIVTRVRIPLADAAAGWGYRQFSRRAGDFAIVAAAATVTMNGNRVGGLRMALGGVESAPVRLAELEKSNLGTEPTPAWAADVAKAAADAVTPSSDLHASAEYRRDLIRSLLCEALTDAVERAGGTL